MNTTTAYAVQSCRRAIVRWASLLVATAVTACAAGASIDQMPTDAERTSQTVHSLTIGGDLCTMAQYDGHTYWFFPNARRSWVDALSKCSALGARLVRVDHPGENAFVQQNLKKSAWLSGNDRATEGRWAWWSAADQYSEGAARIKDYFVNWNVGEPNDFLGEDCAVIDANGSWNDTNCLLQNAYACESIADACPSSSEKTQPGSCGCSTADVDLDKDGVASCFDGCPSDVETATGGTCGCPSNPASQGTACSDGAFSQDKQCDGSGVCGSSTIASVNSNCWFRRYGGSEYLFCHEPATMNEARNRCKSYGAEMLSIDSLGEDQFLYENGHVLGLHWTGATSNSSGTWSWSATDTVFWKSNAPVNGLYQNWLPTQPTLSIGDCSTRDDLSGAWTTMPCTASAGYICEIVDRCPLDPVKRNPGKCGCGRRDTDRNADGVVDCESLTKFDDDPDIDPCLLRIGARPQADTSVMAAMFMTETRTLADYLAVSIDRTDKRNAMFDDPSLCAAIERGDADGDLVPDSTDQCPNTPPLTPTDAVGCTDAYRPSITSDERVRRAVNDFQLIKAKDGVCETGNNRSPELVAGYINNSQLTPAQVALFLNFLPRSCPVRLRVEVLTDSPTGWPYGGGESVYFETGTQDLLPAYSTVDNSVVDGVKSLVIDLPNYMTDFLNIWSELPDSRGNAVGGPAKNVLRARVMAVYGDGFQSAWSNAVTLRPIGDR